MKLRHYKIIALGVILACGMISIPANADEPEDVYPMGVIPSDIKISDPVVKPVKNTKSLRGGTLPSKYDARDEGYVTPVKNQGKYGACWSFATNAAVESSLIKSGFETGDIDLLELHTIYFMYSQNIDPYNRISNDRNYISEDDSGTPTTNFTTMANTGGNSVAAGWQMTDGVIPCEENGDNYNTCCANSAYSLDNSLCFASDYKVKNMLLCNFDENNIENVKRLIYDYGGVAAEFFCEQTTAASTATNQYFNNIEGTKTYYNPNGSQYYSNHGIEVVGWDDNYQKENFKIQPPNDGAWLCKNSWGTTNNNDGYIWLSYYDLSIEAKAVAFEFMKKDSEEITYQYDGSDCLSYIPYSYSNDFYCLAVFTADSAENGKSEVIDKVGVGTDANAEYTISILVNPVFSTKGLKSYEEKAVTECNSTYAGYKLNKLSEPVTVKNGDTFIVCIKAKADTTIFATNERTPAQKGNFGSVEDIQVGQYYFGYSLSYLSGISDGLTGSPIVKAFTSVVSSTPTPSPTLAPTATPTAKPTLAPTATPTAKPTEVPTETPTAKPTAKPTAAPTPTAEPTAKPTEDPTAKPTNEPTAAPTATAKPTEAPTATAKPTEAPTVAPTAKPTDASTPSPTAKPTDVHTVLPTAKPTAKPTVAPTAKPTDASTPEPTAKPSSKPTPAPTVVPTGTPTPSGGDDVKAGSVLVTKTSRFVVTGKNTVAYKAPVKNSVKTVSIPAAISYQGTIYTVTEIEDGAFMNCKKLKKVTISSNITRIGKNAFKGCKKLKTIIIKSSKLKKNTIGTDAFKDIYKKPTFKCPKKKLTSYKKWIKKSGAPKKAKYKKN